MYVPRGAKKTSDSLPATRGQQKREPIADVQLTQSTIQSEAKWGTVRAREDPWSSMPKEDSLLSSTYHPMRGGIPRENNMHSSFYLDYTSQAAPPSQPVRNAISNLAIVRAASQLRDTLNDAGAQLRDKLQSKKTMYASSRRLASSVADYRNRDSTDASSFQRLRPSAGVNTSLQSLSPTLSRGGRSGKNISEATRSPTTTGQKRGSRSSRRKNSLDDG